MHTSSHRCRSSYISDLTDLACSKDIQHGNDKCNALIEKIPPAPANYTAPISVVGPIYQMFITDGVDFDKIKPQ